MLTLGLLLALCITAGLALAPNMALAQERQFHMERYDSLIYVNTDGSLDIEETLVYVFQGQYRRGLRIWETDRLENISDFQVFEVVDGQEVPYDEAGFAPDEPSTSGQPGTFGVEPGNPTRVRWIYEGGPTPSNGTTIKTFIIRYRVEGAIRVYSDRDEFDWYAVPPDWQSPINSSRVEVVLPEVADTSVVTTATVPEDAEVSKQGDTIVYSADGDLEDGFEVGAQIPKGILSATAPRWQGAVDVRERANAEMARIRPVIDLAILVLSLLVGVGGVLFVIRRWYLHGRDKPVKLFSDYVAEPPSNLPPGLVGTLLDESADVRDVIATVVDQARKGNLTIQETRSQGFLTQSKDFEYRKLGGKVEYRFEEMLLDAVFGGKDVTKLSDLKNTFYTKLPPIYDEMYKSLVALKYFPENPKAVRNRNMGSGCGIAVLGGLILFGSFALAPSFTVMLPLLGVAIGVVGLVWVFTSTAMPRKTDFGAEESTKWRAFSNYLQQIQKYTDVQAAADKFQQYLPYAVALGIERQLINQFNNVPAAMPPYYAPYGWHPYGYYPVGTGGPGQQQAGGANAGPMPSFDPGGAMQGMSDSLGGAMQGMADSFTTMVNSASSALTSSPSSSSSGGGGSWGGGGGSFGGGGGGGGGGGAD
ncbi:MAG TPA: DUF2207 domain-containing protein [Chloroflexia bacterium]|jgi:uncharacterized membrane protein YgcG